MTGLSYIDGHDECALCDECARHLTPADQWPCLDCQRMLCGSCDCTRTHIEETCS